MAEFGDTLEKIAADEMARLRQLPDVLHWITDKVQAKARQAAMLKQLDEECYNRRDAVNKRLKHALAREMQAAKDMRPIKRAAKHQRVGMHIAYCIVYCKYIEPYHSRSYIESYQ